MYLMGLQRDPSDSPHSYQNPRPRRPPPLPLNILLFGVLSFSNFMFYLTLRIQGLKGQGMVVLAPKSTKMLTDFHHNFPSKLSAKAPPGPQS